MITREDIRHDATSLCRLVRHTCDVYQPLGPEAYHSPTAEFLTYIDNLSETTILYLDRFAENLPQDSGLYHFDRQKLSEIRSGWTMLHQFVKPAADADTLQVPLSFIHWLTLRLRSVPGYEDVKLAVFHTSVVNYLHLDIDAVWDITKGLALLIPNCKEFPANLGLIGFPYSQASTLFPNCLIPHEIGHYVYLKAKTAERLRPFITQSLERVLDIKGIVTAEVQWCVDCLFSWCREIFCDLVAVWLIGPAYVYAYIDIFDLTRIVSPGGVDLKIECEFSDAYPGHAFRIWQQIDLLRKLKWWPHVLKIKSGYSGVLQLIFKLEEDKFTFRHPENQHLAPRALNAFLSICSEVYELVHTVMKDLEPGVEVYERFGEAIRQHLSLGLVPSSIVRDGENLWPDPIATINAAYALQLESLDGLIGNIEGQDANSARTRGIWTDRLEMWIIKAIEDHSLLVKKASL